jgi:glucan 1,3-beta-glucosidase
MSKIKGVNLGEWLVLEKWMDPSVFEGTDARDEDALCRQLGEEEKLARFKEHRDTFITEKDIALIAQLGLNAVRLPIPHFLFGDDPQFCDPYVPCISYVDNCFTWCKRLGIGIILDIHTAPDSQNGFDNGGICGVSKWHQKKENINRVLDVLEMLAERYGKREELLGIELLNEPASEAVWERNKRFYEAHDKERAEGSSAVPLPIVFDFYTRGYERLRSRMGEDKYVVFHDAFRFSLMKNFFKESRFRKVLLDTHLYLEMEGVTTMTHTENHLRRILVDWNHEIRDMQKTVPVMVGEWSLPHNIRPDLSDEQRYYSYRLMADAFLLTWEQAYAQFFWSYKVKCQDKPGWDFRDCIAKGWLPSRFDGRV